MKINVFGEGATEGAVHSRLSDISNFVSESKYDSAGGKDNLNAKVINTLEPSLGVRPIRCVILRDLDAHEGEDEVRICQSITDSFKRATVRNNQSINLDLVQHSIHTNIYTSQIPEMDFRLSLHIATYKWKQEFINSTTDDYLLELLLRANTVAKLSAKLGIAPEKLSDKITNELPQLLQDNGLYLLEAKNYLQIYAAVTKFSSLTGFLSKALKASDEADIQDVFQPLIAAFEFVGGT